jgi:hypothetical protein
MDSNEFEPDLSPAQELNTLQRLGLRLGGMALIGSTLPILLYWPNDPQGTELPPPLVMAAGVSAVGLHAIIKASQRS